MTLRSDLNVEQLARILYAMQEHSHAAHQKLRAMVAEEIDSLCYGGVLTGLFELKRDRLKETYLETFDSWINPKPNREECEIEAATMLSGDPENPESAETWRRIEALLSAAAAHNISPPENVLSNKAAMIEVIRRLQTRGQYLNFRYHMPANKNGGAEDGPNFSERAMAFVLFMNVVHRLWDASNVDEIYPSA